MSGCWIWEWKTQCPGTNNTRTVLIYSLVRSKQHVIEWERFQKSESGPSVGIGMEGESDCGNRTLSPDPNLMETEPRHKTCTSDNIVASHPITNKSRITSLPHRPYNVVSLCSSPDNIALG